MNTEIYEKINNHFIEREFQVIPTDCDTVKMFATYHKSSLYLINVIALDSNYKFDHEKYNKYKKITRKQFKDVQVDNIILLNLILVEKAEHYYDSFNISPELEKDFIDVNWLIDTSTNALIIPKKQINSVLDLRKEVEGVLGLREDFYVKLTRKNKFSLLTSILIAINVIIWGLLEYYGSSTDGMTLIRFGAMYGPLVIYENEYWRFITSIFIHIGATHLIFNGFSLYIFGSRLEKYLSPLQFVMIYIFSGLFGSAFSLTSQLLSGSENISAGASGAIYGLIGSILICSKLSGKSIEGLNSYTLIVYFFAGMIFSVFSPNIDTSAHVGGFIGGILITILVLKIQKCQSPSFE